MPGDGRRHRADLGGLHPHRVGYLVATPAHGRTNYRADRAGSKISHGIHGPPNDPRHHPRTPCVHRSRDARFLVDQENRGAVSDKDA